MLSFTVCWVIPREWRGWKTSRFRPLAEETTHIYNFFLSSLQAQSSNVGDRQLVSWSPSLCRLLPHASAWLRTQGERAPTTCSGFSSGVRCPQHPGSLWSHKSPSGVSTGLLWPLLSSPPPIPWPGARGQAPGWAGTSGATRNGTSVPIKTHHYVKIHIEIWIDRLDKNGSWFLLV